MLPEFQADGNNKLCQILMGQVRGELKKNQQTQQT